MKAVESSRFLEFLDSVCASLDGPDEQLVHQTFEIQKRRIVETDDLVKCGKLDLRIAEERRFQIQTTAWSTAYKRALNSWITRDKLDEVFALSIEGHACENEVSCVSSTTGLVAGSI